MRTFSVCLVLFAAVVGCSGRRAAKGPFDPFTVEWRHKKGAELTEDQEKALAAAKQFQADDIRGLQVAFSESDSADLRHVEYEIITETDGYKIAGRYIALYHSTGKLNGFPEGYFALKVHGDGTVTRIHEGWE